MPALANVVAALKGSFLRFPGGNNLCVLPVSKPVDLAGLTPVQ